MTKEDIVTFKFMNRLYYQLNSVPDIDINPRTPVESMCATYSKTSDMVAVSDFMHDTNHNGTVVS